MPTTSRQQQAAEARRAKLLEDRRVRDLQLLAEHAARIQTATSHRVTGRKRKPVSEPKGDQRCWWSRPDITARMTAQQERFIPQPTAAYCPECGGHRIRQQRELSETRFLYECPRDYSKTILATGCGHRWVFEIEWE